METITHPNLDMTTDTTKWRVLIVDDEEFIHENLKMNLRDIIYEDKEIEFIHAYSANEAKEIAQNQTDIAVIILDVMMESDDAGLNFVEFIREEINNDDIRILLHTGQPGIAPKRKVSEKYVIDGYLDKNILDNDDCYVAVRLALKAYHDRITLNASSIKDDRSLLGNIAEIYASLLNDPLFNKTYEEVVEKINCMIHLSQKILAAYALKDLENSLKVGTTKSERLSREDYSTLVNIHNIRVILTHTPAEAYERERMIILQAIVKEATRFSSINILPTHCKTLLKTALNNF